jgi:hypothetical protein
MGVKCDCVNTHLSRSPGPWHVGRTAGPLPAEENEEVSFVVVLIMIFPPCL